MQPPPSHSPFTVVSLALETISKQFSQHEMTIRALESENQALRRHNQYLQEKIEALLISQNRPNEKQANSRPSEEEPMNEDAQISLMNNANRIIAALSSTCNFYDNQVAFNNGNLVGDTANLMQPGLQQQSQQIYQECNMLPSFQQQQQLQSASVAQNGIIRPDSLDLASNIASASSSAVSSASSSMISTSSVVPTTGVSSRTIVQTANSRSGSMFSGTPNSIDGESLSAQSQSVRVLFSPSMKTCILETLKIHSRNITSVRWLESNIAYVSTIMQQSQKSSAIATAMASQNFFVSTSKDCTARIWSVPTSVVVAGASPSDNKKDDPTLAATYIVGIDAKCYRADSPITAVCVVNADPAQLSKSIEKMIPNQSLNKSFVSSQIGTYLINTTSFIILGDAEGNIYVHVSPLTLLYAEGNGGLRHRPCSDLTISQLQFSNETSPQADGDSLGIGDSQFKYRMSSKNEQRVVWSILDITDKPLHTIPTDEKMENGPVASFACITSSGIVKMFDICNSDTTPYSRALICEDPSQTDLSDQSADFSKISGVVESYMTRVSAVQVINTRKSLDLVESADSKVKLNVTTAKAVGKFIVAGLRERLWDKDGKFYPVSFTPLVRSDMTGVARRTGPRLVICDTSAGTQSFVTLDQNEITTLVRNSVGIAPVHITDIALYTTYTPGNQFQQQSAECNDSDKPQLSTQVQIPNKTFVSTCSSTFPLLFASVTTNVNSRDSNSDKRISEVSISTLKKPVFVAQNGKQFDFAPINGISCMTVIHNYLVVAKSATILKNPVVALFAIEEQLNDENSVTLRLIKEQYIGTIYGSITSVSATTVNNNSEVAIVMGGVEGALVIATEQ